MAIENDWIVWLNDRAGKDFLGLTHSPQNSRFCVLGKIKGEAFSVGIGIWIEVDHVEERIMPDNRLSRQWSVSPKTCLVPWSLITYAQLGSTSEQIGFVQIV